MFGWPVPDFILWDREVFTRPVPNPTGRRMSPDWVLDLARAAVVQQASPAVVLPDVPLASLVWGPRAGGKRWPPNWRAALAAGLQPAGAAVAAVRPGAVPNPETGGVSFLPDRAAAWKRGEAA